MSQQFESVEFRVFDQVQLRTVKNVKYLSAPSDTQVSPHGVWSVAAVIEIPSGLDLLVVKNGATVRIPAIDVLKVAEYDINTILAPLGKFTNEQGQKRQDSSG